jgi:hypothetical protein
MLCGIFCAHLRSKFSGNEISAWEGRVGTVNGNPDVLSATQFYLIVTVILSETTGGLNG